MIIQGINYSVLKSINWKSKISPKFKDHTHYSYYSKWTESNNKNFDTIKYYYYEVSKDNKIYKARKSKNKQYEKRPIFAL